MPLGQSTDTGGFFKFEELVANAGKPVLVFVKIREFKPKEVGTKRSERGPVLPTVVDVFVADGPDAGTLFEEEEIIGAPTGPLRGVKNPSNRNGWTVSDPVNQVGVPYPFVVKIDNFSGNDYAQLNAPKGSTRKRAEELYDRFGGDKIWTGDADTSWLEREEPAAPAAEDEANKPLGGGDDRPPWESAA